MKTLLILKRSSKSDKTLITKNYLLLCINVLVTYYQGISSFNHHSDLSYMCIKRNTDKLTFQSSHSIKDGGIRMTINEWSWFPFHEYVLCLVLR